MFRSFWEVFLAVTDPFTVPGGPQVVEARPPFVGRTAQADLPGHHNVLTVQRPKPRELDADRVCAGNQRGSVILPRRGFCCSGGSREVRVPWNEDLGDGLEWADDPQYPAEYSSFAFKFVTNVIVYGMTH